MTNPNEIVSAEAVERACSAYDNDGKAIAYVNRMRAALLASGYPQKVAELERDIAVARAAFSETSDALEQWKRAAATREADYNALSRDLDKSESELTRLRAENEALKQDRERYLCLRDMDGIFRIKLDSEGDALWGETLDEAVDAEIEHLAHRLRLSSSPDAHK